MPNVFGDYKRGESRMTFYRNIIRGIKNLITWFPVIWRDRNWDHVFIYNILHFKLKNMEKFFGEDAHYVGCEEDAAIMKKVVDALDRLIEDDYMADMYDKLYEKWGEFKLSSDSGGELFTIGCEKVKTDEDKEAYREEMRVCSDADWKAKEADIALVFNTMRDNIEKWCD